MLKARSGAVVFLGLSDRNLELLREGKPMPIKVADLGGKIPSDGTIVIFHGATEQDCAKQLMEFTSPPF